MKKVNVNSIMSAVAPIYKQFSMAALLAIFVIGSSFASVTNTGNQEAERNFRKEFKNAQEVKWTATNEFAQANFVLAGSKMEVFYDNTDGSLIATTRTMDVSCLPKAAISYIGKNFGDMKVKKCFEYVGSDYEMKYYVGLQSKNKTELYEVDKEGNVTFFLTVR